MKKLLALVLVMSSTVALAQRGMQDQIVLQLDKHLKGQTKIGLKALVRQRYSHIDLANMKLDSVKVVAKSQHGKGDVTLVVGQSVSYPQNVFGTPQNFHNEANWTYAKINLFSPQNADFLGKWQIETRGNLKVKKVVLSVSQKVKKNMMSVGIPMFGQTLLGRNTLHLKQMIKMKNPKINLSNMELEKVKIIAKSRMGRAEAVLVVGQVVSYPKTIAGNPRVFHTNAPGSFNQTVLANPKMNSAGNWQIDLKGSVKIEKIVVMMKKVGNAQTQGPAPRPHLPRRRGHRN